MTVRRQVAPGEARPITEILHALMGAARCERGHVNCSLSTELGDLAQLYYREEWRTEADLQHQVRSARFAQLAQLIERASRRPTVQFHLLTATRGLNYAEEVLGGHEDERQ